MENQLIDGANTLQNLVQLSDNLVIDLKLACFEGKVSVVLQYTPLNAAGKPATIAMPGFKATYNLESLDAEITHDVYQITQDALADSVSRIKEYASTLSAHVENISKPSAIVKPGATMPAPTGKKEPEKKPVPAKGQAAPPPPAPAPAPVMAPVTETPPAMEPEPIDATVTADVQAGVNPLADKLPEPIKEIAKASPNVVIARPAASPFGF